ncbi:MAG TPA: cytochrome P450 [Acidimicrobiales bacterium]|nr:cytochrome P450 [Acidimicrobiales bacterium]
MKVLDTDFWVDPYPVFAQLRAEAPVLWHDDAGLWTVARHDDVMRISRDPATFCSSRGVLPSDRERQITGAESILFLDPPDHQRHRKLVSPAFTPRRISALEERVRELACELLDPIAKGDTVDFAPAVAEPLPMLVIAEMLGVPVEDRDKFKVWSDAMILAATNPSDDSYALAAELWQYFEKIIEQRRVDPADDLISVIAHAEVDDVPLTNADLNGFCMTLLVAGNETTRNLITGGVEALARCPDQLERLVADRSLVSSAVEEMLRWVTPVMNFARTATKDVELRGEQIGAGQMLFMLYGSANRDPEAFGPTADTFDVGRQPNPHMAFGFGEHFCMGASLARLEARVLFDELLQRFSTIELAGDPERLRSSLMRSLVHLPVTVG